jgi:DUF4097 and DUF4098 domain-containing protein YvlB
MGRVLKKDVVRNAASIELGKQQGKAVFLAGLFCLGVLAASAEEIKRNFPTGAKPSLELVNQNGGISVKTWDHNEIEIKANPSSDAIGVMVIPGEQKVTVQTQPKGDRILPSDARVDFEILVPREATVHVDSERGQVSVENVRGDITIEGVSNSVVLSNISGHIMARTVDGPILLRSCEGRVEAHSISGDLKFVRVNAYELVANTNSGTISYEGDFGSKGHYVLTNNLSPINIVASDKASFELTARSVEGSIESNIPFRPTPLGQPFRHLSPGKFLQGLFHGGESTVQITSFSGTIRVHGPR